MAPPNNPGGHLIVKWKEMSKEARHTNGHKVSRKKQGLRTLKFSPKVLQEVAT